MLSAPQTTTVVSGREGHETALLSKRAATSETSVRDARPLKKVSLHSNEIRLVVRRMTCVSHHVCFFEEVRQLCVSSERDLRLWRDCCDSERFLFKTKSTLTTCAWSCARSRFILQPKTRKKQRIMSMSCTCDVQGFKSNNQRLPARLCLCTAKMFDVARYQNMRLCHAVRSTYEGQSDKFCSTTWLHNTSVECEHESVSKALRSKAPFHCAHGSAAFSVAFFVSTSTELLHVRLRDSF